MTMRLLQTTPLLWSRQLSAKQVSFLPRQMSIEAPKQLLKSVELPLRRLFGPGPSNLPKNVEESLTKPLLGHLHAEFLQIMDDVREGCKYVFQTKNKMTFVVSGTGHAGMECALLNVLEQGERILVVQNGLWGQRAAALSKRLRLDVNVISVPNGKAVSLAEFKDALQQYKPQAVFVCQGESSTGVLHPLDGFGEACHDVGALLIVDTVASLCAAPFHADELNVDCVYSASQKALNAPPGLAPISFSDRAVEKIKNRKTQIQSFYLDAIELSNYWGCYGEARRYHHTAPILLVYSLREALATVVREGIDNSVARHQRNAKIFYDQLQKSGFELFVEDETLRLPCLTTVKVPSGVDWAKVKDALMKNGVEIAGGLGETTGKIWRIGTFGLNSDPGRFSDIPTLLKRESKL